MEYTKSKHGERIGFFFFLGLDFRKWLDLKQTGTLKMLFLLDASTITERSLLRVFCLSEYLLNVYIYIYCIYVHSLKICKCDITFGRVSL